MEVMIIDVGLAEKYACKRRIILKIFIGLFLLSAFVFNLPDLLFVTRYRFELKQQGDMQYYYYGGLMIRSGNPQIYQKAEFEKFYTDFPGIASRHAMLNYPPLVYCIFSFFANPSSPISAVGNAWFVLNILFLTASVVLIYLTLYPSGQLLGPRITRMVLFALTAIIFAPVMESLLQGQVNILILLLLSGAFYAGGREKSEVAGMLVGIAASLKIFPAFLFLYFILRRDWKALLSGILTIALVHVCIVLFFGMPLITGYLQNTSGSYMVFMREFIRDNQSPMASIARLFQLNNLNRPLINAHVLTWPLRILWGLLVVGALTLLTLKSGRGDASSNDKPEAGDENPDGRKFFHILFPLFVAALFVINPLVWSHHLPVLILPLVVMIELLLSGESLELPLFIAGIVSSGCYLALQVFDGCVTPLSRPRLNAFRYFFSGSLFPQLLLVAGFIAMFIAGVFIFMEFNKSSRRKCNEE